MKIRKVLKTMAVFLFCTIVICGLSVVIFAIVHSEAKQLDMSEAGKQLGNSFLYMTGYGGLYSEDLVMKFLLAIVGLLALSMLSAYLTSLFLYRTDVEINPKIFVWQDHENHYIGTIIIKNKGRAICNLHMSFDLWRKKDGSGRLDPCELKKPIIAKGGQWREDFRISPTDGHFLYEALQYLVEDKTSVLYILWSFVDTITGQESFHTQAYKYRDFLFCDPILTPCFTKDGMRQMRELFQSWIVQNDHVIPVWSAIPINDSFIKLEHRLLPASQRHELTMAIDCRNFKLQSTNPDDFVMASVQYMQPEDWRTFYDTDWILQFELLGDADIIETVTVEVKKINGQGLEKIRCGEFAVAKRMDNQGSATCLLPLKAKRISRDDFKQIKEVDFTIFFKNIKRYDISTSVSIIGCALTSPVKTIPNTSASYSTQKEEVTV